VFYSCRLDLDLFSKQAKSDGHLGTKVVHALRELFDSLGARVDQQRSITGMQGDEYPGMYDIFHVTVYEYPGM
jgi:hypothetical protein